MWVNFTVEIGYGIVYLGGFSLHGASGGACKHLGGNMCTFWSWCKKFGLDWDLGMDTERYYDNEMREISTFTHIFSFRETRG